MTDFVFLRPIWLLLLPLLALALWKVWQRQRQQRNDWSRVVDAELLLAQTAPATGWTQLLIWLVGALLALAIIAMAGPSFRQVIKPLANSADTRLFLLDISLSMNAHDISPSRMIKAQQVAARLIKESGAYRVGLVAYAGDAWLVAPVTRDSNTVTAFQKIVDTSLAPIQGSRPDLALTFASELITQSNVQRAEIVLFNDGFKGDKVFDTAAKLRSEGHKIIVIAAGTTKGARIPLEDGGYMRSVAGEHVVTKVDANDMQRLATAGGGELHWIGDEPLSLDNTGSTQRDKDADPSATNADRAQEAGGLAVRVDDGPWLLIPALILAALIFRRGALFCLPLLLVCQPTPSIAAEPFSWWWRPDQQVDRAIKQGDLKSAAKLAPDSQWRGIVAYRRGDYTGAALHFGTKTTATAHYNRANALVKQQRYKQALDAYNAALRLQPDHADALYNRDLVLAFVDEQKSQEPDEEQFKLNDNQQSSENRPNDTDPEKQRKNRQSNKTDNEKSAEQTDDAEQSQDKLSEQDTENRVSPAYSENSEAARVDLDQWIKKVPDDPAAWLRRRFNQMQRMREQHVSRRVGDAW